MAIPEPFLQQYLNEFARQMHQSPNPNEHPVIQRIAEARYRQMQQDRLRPPTPEGGGLLDFLKALATVGTMPHSMVAFGNPDLLGSLRGYGRSTRDAKDQLMGGGDPVQAALAMMPLRGNLKGRPGDPEFNALHGADVRDRVIAKRAAKGPRKPGGGRRPAPKPAPEPEPDLATQLALSLPKKAPVPVNRGAVSGILARLRGGRGRRGGR